MVIYAGVCREQFEPATACRVAAELGVGPGTAIFDISNACLGVLNGMVEVANRIELGQSRAGLVVSCETAREINDVMIERLTRKPQHGVFRTSLATLHRRQRCRGGAVDGRLLRRPGRRLLGGMTHAAPKHHELCRWGLEAMLPRPSAVHVHRFGRGAQARRRAGSADVEGVSGPARLGPAKIDKVICHQVGSRPPRRHPAGARHRVEKDFSLRVPRQHRYGVAAVDRRVAEERDFLRPGDRVGFLGIGSGLNCLMLGVEW